jgi:hypothetical protein
MEDTLGKPLDGPPLRACASFEEHTCEFAHSPPLGATLATLVHQIALLVQSPLAHPSQGQQKHTRTTRTHMDVCAYVRKSPEENILYIYEVIINS